MNDDFVVRRAQSVSGPISRHCGHPKFLEPPCRETSLKVALNETCLRLA